MPHTIEKIQQAVSFITKGYAAKPVAGIVLGSGLGNFSTEITIEKEIPYSDIPHFPISTVQGHSGKLILGLVNGKRVVAMAGRFHHYEGYTPGEVVFPIRVMKFLGIKNLLISNAAGGMQKGMEIGDLMLIQDHISFFISNPLVGANEGALGPRFPDMSEPYSRALLAMAKSIAVAAGIKLKEGVYGAVTGPTFETPAEYTLLKTIGCDAVGMSTVQESIAAIHMGLPVFAMSVITDIAWTGNLQKISYEEVLAAAKEAEPKLTYIFKQLIGGM
jgi:purine-nucleoside phosphorylase